MKLKLITFSNNENTIGKLYKKGTSINEDEFICYTIERPWLKNKAYVSCIPAGEYELKQVSSPKFGLTYKVCDVIGRTQILIHKANKASELQGCIAPVSMLGVLGNEIAGLSSKTAYDKLMSLLGSDVHTLEIKRY